MEQADVKVFFNEITGLPNGIKHLRPMKTPLGVPRLINQLYDLVEADILGVPFLLAIADLNKTGIRQIIAHNELLRKTTKRPVTFVINTLKTYQYKALTAQKINFIDLNGNIFIPDALLALRKAKDAMTVTPETLSTWAKVALIKQVLTGALDNCTVSDLATEFLISKMHASRLVTELKALNLIKIKKDGVSKHIQFLDKSTLWGRANDLIRTPVVRRVYTNSKVSAAKLAGLTALGEATLLEAGSVQTLAIGKKTYNGLQSEVLPTDKELAKYCLEVWEWEPELLTTGKIVDPISLYFSLKNEEDDRIQIALKEMIQERIGV